MVASGGSHTSLHPGMYVRFPLDAERDDQEYRDFRIGQVKAVNEAANTATIGMLPQVLDEQSFSSRGHVERPLDEINRCRILPDSPCVETIGSRQGRLLLSCEESWIPGQFRTYFVQFGEAVEQVSEAHLVVASNRQDPEPGRQLLNYEFHSPVWRFDRDALIESYGQLRNATYGVEDLVGSRITLLAHQAEAVARVLSDTRCRYILADEVGLGKTIEAGVILKGLLRRDPHLKTLIVTPASLVQQWHNELDGKFWLDFLKLTETNFGGRERRSIDVDVNRKAGLIVSVEDVASGNDCWDLIQARHWDLLIVDEAHHCPKQPHLYERVRTLSQNAARALILTATPIQRRADEFLSLLTLMDPERYGAISVEDFHRRIAAQDTLRRKIAYLAPSMTPSAFDLDEFVEEVEPVCNLLASDPVLPTLIELVRNYRADHSVEQGLSAARAVLAYISENYRIETRVIRNRRAELKMALPSRTLDTTYSYVPGSWESDTLDSLYDYLGCILSSGEPGNALRSEFCRILLHAAASSPYALLDLLQQREATIKAGAMLGKGTEHSNGSRRGRPVSFDLTRPAASRLEPARIAQLIRTVPSVADEKRLLQDVIWRAERWREQTDDALADAQEIRPHDFKAPSSHRLVQALRALYTCLNDRTQRKVLVFSSWPQTLALLSTPLVKSYGKRIVAEFRAGMDDEALQQAADAFQADPQCAVLLCDELGGEGRNFQIADAIIHLDLPWTPAQIEQRIGRVDRLGRTGTVRSIVPFAQNQLEHDLFRIWQDALKLFEESMSGLEIALEGIQDELLAALNTSLREGLANILSSMAERAGDLRQEINEERYFESWAIDSRRRKEFDEVSARYRDGSRLRKPFLRWAQVAGLSPHSDDFGDIFHFSPREFNDKSMRNAKLFELPNMEEALRRSRHRRDFVIAGTFDRDVAVRREDLVFFAPGGDPWTDAIIRNALEADRGRCCAVFRSAPELTTRWQGYELLYSLSIDPRPLYAAGFTPTHLFRAQGFLPIATYRVLIAHTGQVMEKASAVAEVVKRPFDKRRDHHLGKRDQPGAQIHGFKQRYPFDKWSTVVERVLQAADTKLDDEFGFMAEEAVEAEQVFIRRAEGWRAALQWQRQSPSVDDAHDVAEYARVSHALVESIRHPLRRLESVCFWYLQPEAPR